MQVPQFVIIADTFPPNRNSGAVQLRDLSKQMLNVGCKLTIIVPNDSGLQPITIDARGQLTIIRIRLSALGGNNLFRRAIREMSMPFVMLWHLRRSTVWSEKFDGIIWYSPSIFLGPVAHVLKWRSNCKSYLILRDIFPDWAADLGIIRKGLIYYFFKLVAFYQYCLADTIGVQTASALRLFEWKERRSKGSVEVLENWLGKEGNKVCPINIGNTPLRGRTILVYAGNMGEAQNVFRLLSLAQATQEREDIGFLMVGRGTQAQQLKDDAKRKNITNMLFHEQIEPDEVPSLFAQCAIGLVLLDPKFKSHNIPGKFLAYIQSGLPIFAMLNPNNDLFAVISNNDVGLASDSDNIDHLKNQLYSLVDKIKQDKKIKQRCLNLFESHYGVEKAVYQILGALGVSNAKSHPDCLGNEKRVL